MLFNANAATLFLILSFIPIALYHMHKFFLWLEQKGWLYYRHKKPQSGVLGSALQELNAMLQPSSRHTIEMKQNKVRFKRSESDVPSGSKNE